MALARITMTRELRAQLKLVRPFAESPAGYAAKPYYEALVMTIDGDDSFGHDSVRDMLQYLVSNLAGWRGQDAREVKAYLRGLLK